MTPTPETIVTILGYRSEKQEYVSISRAIKHIAPLLKVSKKYGEINQFDVSDETGFSKDEIYAIADGTYVPKKKKRKSDSISETEITDTDEN